MVQKFGGIADGELVRKSLAIMLHLISHRVLISFLSKRDVRTYSFLDIHFLPCHFVPERKLSNGLTCLKGAEKLFYSP